MTPPRALREPFDPATHPRLSAVRPTILTGPHQAPAGGCPLCWHPVTPPHAYCTPACRHVDELRGRSLTSTLEASTVNGQPLTAKTRKEIEVNRTGKVGGS